MTEGKNNKKISIRNLDSALRLRFMLPAFLEQIFFVVINLVITQTFSSISKSSLAAISLSNQVFKVIEVVFNFLVTSLGVIVSRLVGAGEYADAKHTSEKALFFAGSFTTIVVILGELFANPLIKLFAKTDDLQLISEATQYFRILLLSLIPLILMNALFFILRSMGFSLSLLIAQIIVNVSVLLFANIFIRVLHMDETGAAYSYLIARVAGLIFAIAVTARNRKMFRIELKNCITPDFKVLKRFLKIGTPIAMESTIVQVGYLVNSSLSIGLSTAEANAYSITNTVNEFSSIPWSPISNICRTANGHLFGAKKYREAKVATRFLLALALAITLVLDIIVIAFARPISSLYSSDAEVINYASSAMIMLLFVDMIGTVINTLLAKLLAAGDTKFLMIVTVIGVVVVRIPLSFVFTQVLSLGIIGLHLSNIASLTFRATCLITRLLRNHYFHEKV